MTWSSNSSARARAGAPKADRRASAWDWAELEGAGRPLPAEEERAAEEQRLLDIENAYRRGYAEGQDAAEARAREELASAMSATLRALEDIRAGRDAWEERLHDDLVLLAAAMTRHIVDRTIADDPDLFAELAKKAVAALPGDEGVRIRLHPDDLNRLQESGSVEDVVESRTVRWVPDEEVVPGGCTVEGPEKIVDGRIDEAVLRLVRAMTHG
jgi:flagellar biosynthesis/type III secretory pathway protein FliH